MPDYGSVDFQKTSGPSFVSVEFFRKHCDGFGMLRMGLRLRVPYEGKSNKFSERELEPYYANRIPDGSLLERIETSAVGNNSVPTDYASKARALSHSVECFRECICA